MTDLLAVTQADRDAVQAFHRTMAARLMTDITSTDRPKLGEDEGDAGTLVQAFARHRLEALRTQGEGEGWRLITDLPAAPCNVLLICPPFVWTDQHGNPVPHQPMRDEIERMELGFWDGEMWCEAGTGHDIISDLRPPHLMPTHWRPLPAAPTQASSREEGDA